MSARQLPQPEPERRSIAGGPLATGAAIATSGLSKDYGAGRGLFDLDLEVQPW